VLYLLLFKLDKGKTMIKYFSDTPTLEARAVQIWQILIGKAYNRQVTTCREIADILGYEGAGVLAGVLDRQLRHIMFFCSQNKLPPLTVLVVSGDTDLPCKWFKTRNDLHRERENVFKYDWFSIYPPTASEFAEAYEAARKNNWII
jgi:putative restriction endonuclease